MIIPGSWACTWVRITCIERWVFVLVCKMVSCHFEWHQYKDVIIADTLYVLVWFNIQQQFSKIRICLRFFLGRAGAVEKHLPVPAQPQGSRLIEDCLLHFTFLYKKYPLIPPQCDIMNLLSATPARKPQMIVCRALANRQAHNLHKSTQKQSWQASQCSTDIRSKRQPSHKVAITHNPKEKKP